LETRPQAPPPPLVALLRPARPWGLIALLVVLVTGGLLGWHSLTDIDVWFHLRSGRDILAGGGFPAVNTYSFSEPDHPWLNHEWLFQTVIAALGPDTTPAGAEPSVGAWNLLRVLLGMAVVVLLAWAGGLFRRMQGASPGAAAWTGVALLGGLALLWPRLTLRPELLSYLGLILVVEMADRLGERPSAAGSPGRGLRAGPALAILGTTLVWAQCHGFAALVPLIVALAALLAPLDRSWRRLPPGAGFGGKRWGLLLLAVVLLLAATPNGWRGLVFPLRALGQFGGAGVDLRRTVSELAPLLESPASLAWTIRFFLAGLVWGLVWIVARWRSVSLLRIALFAGAAVAAWTNQRNIGLFAIAFVLLHAPAAVPASPLIRIRRPAFLKPHWIALWGLVVLVGAAGLWWPAITGDRFYLHEGVGRRFGGGVNPARFPLAATAALAADGAARYFANLDGAAFALAHAPGRIFIDGRTEAYSPGRWREYLAVKAGGAPALALLDGHRVDAVCLATGSGAFAALVATLREAATWRLRAADGGGLLFVRADAAAAGSELRVLQTGYRTAAALAGNARGVRRADHLLAASRLADLAGDPAARRESLEEGVRAAPGHPVLLHNLGNLRMAGEDWASARDLFTAALAANPRQAPSALNAGVCAVRLGDRKTARRYFRRAVRLDPSSFAGWMNLAVTELDLGDREAAGRAAARAAALKPGDANAAALLRRLAR
jgi:hypothetical protein